MKNGLLPYSKKKGFPGRKESLRSIAARFDGVLARLIGIGMILLANLPRILMLCLQTRQIFAACKKFLAHHLLHILPSILHNFSIISAF